MGKVVGILLLTLALAGCATAPGAPRAEAPWSSGVHWRPTLEEGRTEAESSRKPLLVDFYVPTGCPRCSLMERFIYGDPEIAETINRDFVPVKVNLARPLTEGEKELGKRYHFNFDCLLVFMTPDGDVIEDEKLGRFCFATVPDRDSFLRNLETAKGFSADR